LNIPSFINRINKPQHNKSLSHNDFHRQHLAAGNTLGISSNNQILQNGTINHNMFRGAPNSYLGAEFGEKE